MNLSLSPGITRAGADVGADMGMGEGQLVLYPCPNPYPERECGYIMGYGCGYAPGYPGVYPSQSLMLV